MLYLKQTNTEHGQSQEHFYKYSTFFSPCFWNTTHFSVDNVMAQGLSYAAPLPFFVYHKEFLNEIIRDHADIQ